VETRKIIYVELKSGFSDNGPAWIGFELRSRSGSTLYFNGLALKKLRGGGITGNYFDIVTGEEYWVSGVKKSGDNRHWSGHGKIVLQTEAKAEYLNYMDLSELPPNIELGNLKLNDISSSHSLENSKSGG